jgi:polyisoprenoid-binding protein YceI
MRTTCLAVDRFPAIVFLPSRFTPAGAGGAGGSAQGTLAGDLTIRDVTRPVSMTATLADEGKRVVVSGTFDVAWGDFGVPDPSFGLLRVDKVAHAHFRAEFVPAAQ